MTEIPQDEVVLDDVLDLVSELAAIEGRARVDVLCTDKTGALTNRECG